VLLFLIGCRCFARAFEMCFGPGILMAMMARGRIRGGDGVWLIACLVGVLL